MAPVDRDLFVRDIPPAPAKLGVIKEARRRQRRRRAALAALSAAGVLAVVAGFGGGASGPHPTGSGAPASFGHAPIVAPGEVFAESPYMGISCPVANSIACDRVGLAVWPFKAATVRATVAGLALRLNNPTWSTVDQVGGQAVYRYAGFLRPADLTTRLHLVPDAAPSTWIGQHPAIASTWFRIDFGHSDVVITHENIPLEPGWG